MNEELDYTDEAALALEEEWDTLTEDVDLDLPEGLHEDMEDDEDGDLFDILERGGWA